MSDRPEPSFGHAVKEIARKEIVQHIKSMRVLIVSLLFFISIVLTTLVFPLAFGSDPEAGEQNLYFGAFLGAGGFTFLGGLFFIQLLAIILTADGVTSEWQRRTIFLVLSKPVSRNALLLGKLLGAFITVTVPFVALMLLDYLLLMAVFPGMPTGDEVVRFFGALGILVLGAGTFCAFGLFMSSLTRSSVAAFVLALTLWILVFPMLALPGQIMYAVDARGFEGPVEDMPSRDDWKYRAWDLVNPGFGMATASDIIVEQEGRSWRQGPPDAWLGPVHLLVYTAVFLGGALLRVGRRDFE